MVDEDNAARAARLVYVLGDKVRQMPPSIVNLLWPVSYTHLRAHETVLDLVCRLLLEKKKNNTKYVYVILTTNRTTQIIMYYTILQHEEVTHNNHI